MIGIFQERGIMAPGKGREQAGLREHEEALASAQADLPPLAAVTGDNEYLRSAATGKLKAAWLQRFPDGDVSTLRGAGDARPAGLADIARELSGGSLFAKDKLVIVRQAEKPLFGQAGRTEEEEAPAAKAGEREQGFIERLENPGKRIWLILETAQLPKNRTLGKRVAQHCRVIPCPTPTQRDIPPFLRARAKESGVRIDDEAIDLLTRAYGTNLGLLASEMEKLALYAGEGKDIDAAAAGKFLAGAIEFDVFGFTNAIEARNPEQALFYARRITTQGTRDQKGKREDGEKSSHRIMAMLAGTVQNLLRAAVALARGTPADEFAAREKLSPWRAGKLYQASGNFTIRELRLMAAFAADQIRRTHDTGGDVALALELMAVKFTVPGAL